MVTDAVWQDIDNDNIKDLIVVGEWMPITIFTNKEGQLKKTASVNEQFKFTNGWWNCIKAVDIDNDGDIDFIAGNLGLNSKIKADSIHPVELYINDFDKNGIGECILTYYKSDGKSYPYYLKNDITEQMPSLKKKFLKHSDYAGKTINEIFNQKQLDTSIIKKAYDFKTCLFINNGKGKFDIKPLPDEAQMSPVFGIMADDLNRDGIKDIYLAGNLYGLKPELGRYDANFGVVFRGKENHQFEYYNQVFFIFVQKRTFIQLIYN